MKQAFKYSLKVSSTSGLIATILFIVASTSIFHYHFSLMYELTWIIRSFVFYLMVNLLAWAITLLWLSWAYKRRISVTITKSVSFVLVEIVVCIILFGVFGITDMAGWIMVVSTVVSTAFFIWFYKYSHGAEVLRVE